MGGLLRFSHYGDVALRCFPQGRGDRRPGGHPRHSRAVALLSARRGEGRTPPKGGSPEARGASMDKCRFVWCGLRRVWWRMG